MHRLCLWTFLDMYPTMILCSCFNIQTARLEDYTGQRCMGSVYSFLNIYLISSLCFCLIFRMLGSIKLASALSLRAVNLYQVYLFAILIASHFNLSDNDRFRYLP